MILAVMDYPKAILHVDGDAFFASCAQALDPKLKGKPVVTGSERGIATAVSYEARAFGVKRGMRGDEIKRICPECVFAPSDYEAYALFSHKMINIVRRFTPLVEEYSIDECFADLTGLRRPLHKSYEEISLEIKKKLEIETGLSFSLGLAPTKVVAKIASGWDKPSGLVAIPGRLIHQYLKELPLVEVWGIGPQTAAYLTKLGVDNALEFAQKKIGWVERYLTKPHQEIWQELNGKISYRVEMGKKPVQSITRSRTFHPASGGESFLFARLTENIESACAQLRRHNQAASKIFFFLKTDGFAFRGGEIKLKVATNIPLSVATAIKSNWGKVFEKGSLYRATGVVLAGLSDQQEGQLDLFGQADQEAKLRKIFRGLDELEQKYHQSVGLASGLVGSQSEVKSAITNFRGKSLNLPFLGVAG